MVTLTTAENALKSVYLGVVSNQLNIKANPLLSKIKQTTGDVWGKEVVKLAPFGLNGGFGAGSEDGALPMANANNYVQFKAALKNLYGKIELSDKAIRASQHSSGAFVNLLNSEMENLVKSSTFNLGRMLYGNGTGSLTTEYVAYPNNDFITTPDFKNFVEGMIVDIIDIDPSKGEAVKFAGSPLTVTRVDRLNGKVYFNGTLPQSINYLTDIITVQNSYNKEILGLGAIFGTDTSLYGVDRTQNYWMNPYKNEEVGQITDSVIQQAIDNLDELYSSEADYICCGSDVKRYYQEYLNTFRRNIDYMELNGGFKAMSYGGIPIVSDKFISNGTMYILNTKDFNLHQLCDWTWLEGDDGRILKQNAGYPTYTATLVKYAELICDKPAGQAKLSGITATDTSNYSADIAANTRIIAESTELLSTNYEIVNADAILG